MKTHYALRRGNERVRGECGSAGSAVIVALGIACVILHQTMR
jgi:hypothetical protein